MCESTADRKLFEIFEEAFDLYYSFETNQLPTNSSEFQLDIKKCIQLFEDSTRLVSICGLFSSNESYTEVSTSNLKYLLLPFFLGTLTQKLCGGSRSDVIEVAEVYFKDFLKRSEEYGLFEASSTSGLDVARRTDELNNDKNASLTMQVVQRNNKIEKYRQKKELEDQIKQLKMVMKQENVDDDSKRDFYVKLLNMSIIEAQDELVSIDQEKKILEFQRNRPEQSERPEKRRPTSNVRPLKPIIITRDLAQKAVYGLGYPSLPTMTVAEFYDQRVREGIFPDPNKPRQQPKQQHLPDTIDSDPEEIEREAKLEKDDDYELARLRAKDNYKDEHRRGEGNRHNRS